LLTRRNVASKFRLNASSSTEVLLPGIRSASVKIDNSWKMGDTEIKYSNQIQNQMPNYSVGYRSRMPCCEIKIMVLIGKSMVLI
jgi:hypothetical protein